jgi:hypothetical protein
MAPHHGTRNAFTLIFTAGAAALFLITTGLIGWQPPARLDLDRATWRSGIWTGGIIWRQVALGVAFLALTVLVARRVNRGMRGPR